MTTKHVSLKAVNPTQKPLLARLREPWRGDNRFKPLIVTEAADEIDALNRQVEMLGNECDIITSAISDVAFKFGFCDKGEQLGILQLVSSCSKLSGAYDTLIERYECNTALLNSRTGFMIRFNALRELMGHVENGTSVTVKLYQDDATGDFVIEVDGSKQCYFGKSLGAAVDNAIIMRTGESDDN